MQIDSVYARAAGDRVGSALGVLGVSVPEAFRSFYEQHGGPFGSRNTGFILLDLYDGEPNIISQTLSCRELYGWPAKFIVLTDLLANAVLVLDAEEGHVLNVDFEGGDEELIAGALEPSWDSFLRFLEDYFR
jgi:hypothetical protein